MQAYNLKKVLSNLRGYLVHPNRRKKAKSLFIALKSDYICIDEEDFKEKFYEIGYVSSNHHGEVSFNTNSINVDRKESVTIECFLPRDLHLGDEEQLEDIIGDEFVVVVKEPDNDRFFILGEEDTLVVTYLTSIKANDRYDKVTLTFQAQEPEKVMTDIDIVLDILLT